MPYYVAPEESEWDEYLAQSETVDVPPVSAYKCIQPWQAKTTLLRISLNCPAEEPEVPPKHPAQSPAIHSEALALCTPDRQAEQLPVARGTAHLSPEQLFEVYRKREEAACARALWKISTDAPHRAVLQA